VATVEAVLITALIGSALCVAGAAFFAVYKLFRRQT